MSATTSNPHPTIGKRLFAIFLWALLAAVFGLVAWFVMLGPVFTAVGNWNLARDYRAVQATVVQHAANDENGNFFWYGARYDEGGKSYEASRLSVLEDEAIDEKYNATIHNKLEAAFKAQQSVEIWVSPRVPDVALMSRELPISSLWVRAAVGLAFGIFALAGVAGVIGALTGMGYYSRLLDAAPMWGFSAVWCGFILPIFMMVTNTPDIEWLAVGLVGVFVLIGLLILWVAIHVSFTGAANTASTSRVGRKLNNAALATSYGQGKAKAKSVKGDVKRGGIGGRGANFDKD